VGVVKTGGFQYNGRVVWTTFDPDVDDIRENTKSREKKKGKGGGGWFPSLKRVRFTITEGWMR